MIIWKDFILDDVCGPLLSEEALGSIQVQVCRGSKRFGSPSVRNDANGEIQETRQEQRPARMVGLSSLDFNCLPDMEVGRDNRTEYSRQGEGV